MVKFGICAAILGSASLLLSTTAQLVAPSGFLGSAVAVMASAAIEEERALVTSSIEDRAPLASFGSANEPLSATPTFNTALATGIDPSAVTEVPAYDAANVHLRYARSRFTATYYSYTSRYFGTGFEPPPIATRSHPDHTRTCWRDATIAMLKWRYECKAWNREGKGNCVWPEPNPRECCKSEHDQEGGEKPFGIYICRNFWPRCDAETHVCDSCIFVQKNGKREVRCKDTNAPEWCYCGSIDRGEGCKTHHQNNGGTWVTGVCAIDWAEQENDHWQDQPM